MTKTAILARMLANLKGLYLARREYREAGWVLRLRTAIPGVPLDERRRLTEALAGSRPVPEGRGRPRGPGHAASQREDARKVLRDSRAMRARLN